MKTGILLATIQLLPCSLALAENYPASFQTHGFASQAYLLSDHNNFFGNSSEHGSLDFTELGINVNWQPSTSVRLAGQILSRHAGELDDGKPRIDYALIDYRITDLPDRLLGVRLGRVKIPFGLYNETRDVAHTRPSILLPQSIYSEQIRNIILSMDGGLLYAESRGPYGSLSLDLQIGKFRKKELDDLIGSSSVDDTRAHVGRLVYRGPDRALEAGLYQLHGTLDLSLGSTLLSSLLPPIKGTLEADYNGAFIQYSPGLLTLTAEYVREKTTIKDVTPLPGIGTLIPDQSFSADNAYIQASYRFRPDCEGFIRFDGEFNDHDTIATSSSLSAFSTTRPSHANYSRDWTMGARWDLTQNLMLRTELHVIDGTSWLPSSDNPDRLATTRRWNLLAAQIGYRF